MALTLYIAHSFLYRASHLALRPLLAILNFISNQGDRIGRLFYRRPCLSPYHLEIIPRSFNEEADPDPNLRICSVSFYLRRDPYKWRCKATFRGALPTSKSTAQKKRQDLEDLCHCIDFGNHPPQDDTVTEFLMTRDPASRNSPLQQPPRAISEYWPIKDELAIHVQEDPNRVVFPIFTYPPNVQLVDISRIQKIRRLHCGVHEVRLGDNESTYVYKEVDQPMYVRGDSDVLEREFQNLQYSRHTMR